MTKQQNQQQPQSELEALLSRTTVKQYSTVALRQQRSGVIYTRVSSQEQAENNSSLEVQLKLCNEYAKRTGIVVKEYFGGTYESAKTDGRKEFLRLLSYVKKDKEISFIIVYNYDRFSRTGPAAAQLSDELRKVGITVKSVTQELDSSTPSGRLQENFFHLFNHYDNDQRSNRTSVNTREVMLKGYWPYHTPLGYQNLKAKHRACDHQYVITEHGKLLKKAFEWKGEGVLTNKEIIEKLSSRGLRLTEKNFRWVLSNPFYAGYVTGKLVGGQLIRGQHPALVDLKTFMKANDLLQSAVNVGIPKEHRKEELPLKVFAREWASGSPLTGYLKKGNWYYKARSKGVGVNINAKQLNATFETLLKNFEYNKAHKAKLKKALVEGLKKRLASTIEETTQLKKQLTEVSNLIEKVEERFAIGEINRAIYEKVAAKYEGEKGKIEEELKEKAFDSSNLETAVEKALQIAQNLSGLWHSSDYIRKQQLQYLVFPQGILYNKEKGAVRTERINELFAAIPHPERLSEENNNGHSNKNGRLSDSVPGTGIEPAHSCERQILSLLRLPIPPPGLFESFNTAEKKICTNLTAF